MKALHDTCEISSGFSFRGRVTDEPSGTVAVVQLGDVDWNAERIDWDELPRMTDIEPSPRHFLRDGDVLFAAKGRTNRSILVPQVLNTVAASTFFVIRAYASEVIPAYVAWYLNTAPAQAHFLACGRGTNIRSITKKCLGFLPIPVPPLSAQHRIADVVHLAREERDLAATLLERKAQVVEALALRFAHAATDSQSHYETA